MSELDKRVVQLEFDNTQFEKNVKQSMSTIDELDKKLKFKNVSESIDKVKVSFTVMEVAAISALTNITNRVVNLGIQLIKSLSIDNISVGWDKFGQKTTAVATMAAQAIKVAGKEFDTYELKMEAINEQLNKLNWFSDETSYNFTDMVDNIGKFTAAGQDLDKSVNAMMGIANWAALSGQNASTASRAMYQLAQSLGKGYVQLIDYKSIQNANMDTQEFRQIILDTAVAMGELTKSADKYITKTGSKFNIDQFSSQLSDKWFTSDVLIGGLNKYSAAVERIYEISEATGLTAIQVMEKYSDELEEFGLKAFKAAQEARTFKEVLTAIKDAVSTGWMNTAEKIFGNYDEAKVLWSSLADELYSVFVEGGNFRNDILGIWKKLKGRDDLFGKHGDSNQGSFWNLYDSVIAVKNIISDAWNDIFPKTIFSGYNDQINDLGKKLQTFTTQIQSFTKRIKDTLTNNKKLQMVFQGLFSVLKIGIQVILGIRQAIDPLFILFKNIFSYLFDKIAVFGMSLSKIEDILFKVQNASSIISDSLYEFVDAIDVVNILDTFFNYLTDIKNMIKDMKIIDNITDLIKDFFRTLKSSGGNANSFKKIISGLVSIFSIFAKITIELSKIIIKYIGPILNFVVQIALNLASALSGILISIFGFIGDIFTELNNLLNGESESFDDFGKTFTDFVSSLGNKLKLLTPIVKSVANIIHSLIELILLIPKMLDNISKSLTGKSLIDNMIKLFDKIAKVLSDFKTNVENYEPGENGELTFGQALRSVIEGIISVFTGIFSIIKPALSLVGQILNLLGDILSSIGIFFQKIVGVYKNKGIKEALSSLAGWVVALVAVSAAIISIYWLIDTIKSWISPLHYLTENVSDLFWNIGQSLKFNAISRIINGIAFSIIAFAIGLKIIAGIPTNDLIKSVSVLGIFAGVIVSLIVVLTLITNKSKDMESIIHIAKKQMDVTFLAGNQYLNQMARLLSALGTALLKVSLSIFILTKLDQEKVKTSSEILLLFLGAIAAFIFVTSKFASDEATGQLKDVTGQLKKTIRLIIGVSSSILLLSTAIKKISTIDSDDAWRSVEIIGALLGGLTLITVVILKTTENTSALNKATKFFAAISGVLLIMAIVLNIMNGLDKEKTKFSIKSILLLLSGFTLIALGISRASKNNTSLSKAMNFFAAISGILLIIMIVLSVMNSLNQENTKFSIKAILTLLAGFSILTVAISRFSKSNKTLEKTIPFFFTMAGVISLLTISLAILSSLNQENLFSSIKSLLFLLAGFSAAVFVISKFSKSNKTLEKAIPFFFTMAGVISLLTIPLAILSSLDQTKLFYAIGSLSILLLVMTALATLSGMAKSGGDTAAVAGSLLLMSLAIVALTAALLCLQLISWPTIGKGAAVIAGTFVLLGVAALLLKPIIPIVLLLAAAVLLFGSGLLLAALSLPIFSASLVAFAENLLVFVAALIANVLLIAEALNTIGPLLITALITSFQSLFDNLSTLFPSIFNFLKVLLNGIINLIKEFIPKLVNLLLFLITTVLQALEQNSTVIAQTIFNIILNILNVVATNIRAVVQVLIDILLTIIKTLSDNIGKIVATLIDLLINIVEEVFDNILPLITVLVTKIFDFLSKVIPLLINELLKFVDVIASALILVIGKALGVAVKLLGTIAKLLLNFLASVIMLLVHVWIGMGSILLEAFRTILYNIFDVINRLIFTIVYDIPKLLGSSFQSLIGAIVKLLGEQIKEIPLLGWLGDQMIEKGTSMIKNAKNSLSAEILRGDNVKNALATASNNISNVLAWSMENNQDIIASGINILSDNVTEQMKKAGGQTVKGFVQGVDDNKGDIADTFTDMANTGTNSAESALGIESPSKVFYRIGEFIMFGLRNGIEDKADIAKKSLVSIMNDTLHSIDKVIDSDMDNELTIRPILDLSSVSKGVNTISSLMNNVSDGRFSVTGELATNVSNNMNKKYKNLENQNGSIINNAGDNYNATFNVVSNNPEEIAKEVDIRLQKMHYRSTLAKGGAK